VAARNNVQATDASAAKTGCHALSVLVLMKRMNPARIFSVKLWMMMMMM